MAKVLVVDDEKSIRLTLSRFLADDGHEVLTAGDANEALAILSAFRADVVVSDIVLPGASGVQLLRQIRETVPGAQVIMVTGEPSVETAAEAVRCGAFDYLCKPILKDPILRTVANAARVRQLADQKTQLEAENLRYQMHLEELVAARTRSLGESEERYRHLVDNLAEGLSVVDENDIFIFANPAQEAVFGVPPGGLVGKSLLDFVPPEQRHLIRSGTEARREGRTTTYDLEIIRPDREHRITRNTVSPRFDTAGRYVGATALSQDITEQSRAEAVREAVYRLAEAVASDSPLEDFYADVHEIVLSLMPARNLFIADWNAETGILSFPYFADEHEPAPKPGAYIGSLSRYVIEHAEPFLLGSKRREELIEQGRLMPYGPSAIDWLGVPLTFGGAVIGMLAVQSYDQAVRFGERERDLLMLVSHHIAGAIERKRAQEALKASEERYALAASGANDGLWDWDLRTDRLYFSPRWKEMLGHEEEEIGDLPAEWLDRVHPDDRRSLDRRIKVHQESRSGHFEVEYRIRHRDATYRWMLCRGLAIRDESGKALRMAGSQTDITDRKVAEEQLLHDAFHDGLTGIANRALFHDWLARCVARSNRHSGYQFAVLFLDLDRFKNVNDSMGHVMGDHLLVSMCERLQMCLRSQDALARFGGDEFCILLDDLSDTTEATRVAERILESLRHPFNLGGTELFITASIGIACSATGYRSPDDMLRDADNAMYQAKAYRRGTYRLFDDAMRVNVVHRLQLENDLRRAMEHNELRLVYQPIVKLPHGELDGFEVLMRWTHPGRGAVSPGEFIPLAEETGLIIPISEWCVKTACRQMKQWSDQFGTRDRLSVSINISPRLFLWSNLMNLVEGALGDSRLASSQLNLEITEGALMEDPVGAAATLSRLRPLGLHVHLDDFGTGYSSLSYLYRFEFDELKIDQSFVRSIHEQPKNAEIIRTILMLSRNLGLTVIAEGVETEEQRQFLTSLDCGKAQGYLFSKPLELAQVAPFIERSVNSSGCALRAASTPSDRR